MLAAKFGWNNYNKVLFSNFRTTLNIYILYPISTTTENILFYFKDAIPLHTFVSVNMCWCGCRRKFVRTIFCSVSLILSPTAVCERTIKHESHASLSGGVDWIKSDGRRDRSVPTGRTTALKTATTAVIRCADRTGVRMKSSTLKKKLVFLFFLNATLAQLVFPNTHTLWYACCWWAVDGDAVTEFHFSGSEVSWRAKLERFCWSSRSATMLLTAIQWCSESESIKNMFFC